MGLVKSSTDSMRVSRCAHAGLRVGIQGSATASTKAGSIKGSSPCIVYHGVTVGQPQQVTRLGQAVTARRVVFVGENGVNLVAGTGVQNLGIISGNHHTHGRQARRCTRWPREPPWGSRQYRPEACSGVGWRPVGPGSKRCRPWPSQVGFFVGQWALRPPAKTGIPSRTG